MIDGPALRRTPCIGVCSTTYGDLVCRGCKRFSHEIVGWNGYTDAQQNIVWRRLKELHVQAIESIVRIDNLSVFRFARSKMALTLPDAFVCLEFIRSKEVLADMGIKVRSDLEGSTHQVIVRAIDQEYFVRSRAYYERSFKISTS